MMEDDSNDGPFTVWQMFNAPTLVLFNNLEHAADGLDRLLTSILKLSGDFTEVLVPRPGVSKWPDSYYHAFNTWLIGRLFYICSVDDLKRIHITSKEAQIKILNILCTNGASFYKSLHSEYYTILITLLQYYRDFPSEKVKAITLENFTPEKIVIPNVDIHLDPIYVKVDNIMTCKTLIDLVLQLLSESIPPGLLYCIKQDLEEDVFAEVLNAIEDFSMDLKYMGFSFFLNLIKNINTNTISKFHDLFPCIYQRLLSSLEALVQLMSVLHDKSEIDTNLLNDLNKIVLELIKNMENNIESESSVIGICSIILRNKTSRIFHQELKLYCLSLSCKINLSEELLMITEIDSSQIHELSNCYSKNIAEHIRSNRKVERKINLKENWYYIQVISVINGIKSCEDINIDTFLANYHLQRCHKALGILEIVSIEDKMYISEKGQTVYEFINRQNILNIWHTLSKLIKHHQSMIVGNETSLELIMNIVLSTINLSENITREDANLILEILCLQTSATFSEHNLLFSDTIKKIVLKYLLIAKIYLKAGVTEKWNKIITFLYSSVIKNQDLDVSRNVTDLFPFMQINKMISASKIIGDNLMPVFMIKDVDLQMEILKVIPAIACMSLGSHSIIISNAKNPTGQVIFTNSVISICVNCFNCHNFNENVSNSEDFCSQVKKEFKVLHSDSNLMTPTKISIFTGLKKLFGKFINMNICKEIGDDFWKIVRRLCNHYYIFDFEVSTKIINESYLLEGLKVFKPFIDSTQNHKHPEWISKIDVLISLFIKLLVSSTCTSLENNDYTMQATTLDCIKELGLCHNDKLIFPITKLLIYYIMHPLCSLSPKAIVDLRDVCEFHNQTPNQVYHRYKKDYCKLFVECSLYNGKDFAVYLLKVVRAFGFIGYRDFISKDIHHFLPYLIPYAAVVKEVPSMIEEIATLVQCSVSDFLIERFPHIYVHVYLTESNEAAKKCYDVIEKLTKTSTRNLIKRHFRVILTEFLLQYCVNPEKVLDACRYLACHDPDVSTPQYSMSMSTTQIAEFLNPKFLGVLAYFDHKLVNSKVALSVKRKALKSFPDIMQLMGTQYLTPLRFKVLATLRSALPLAKEFPKILAEAWGSFVHNIDSISLGPLLSNLAVSLLQQFEYAPHEINKIFQYIILKNENLLSAHISDLFFVEDSKISERVKIVIKKHVKRTQPDGFQDRIKWYLQHLNHDISNIKASAFSHLNKLLKNNRSEIHRAIFGGKNIEPIMVELIDSLLVGCKEASAAVSLASGACLGQLGAVEAGHLPRQYVQPDRSPFAFSISDDCFAATALVELTRAFQYEKDTMNMDCYALTIQEILKIYDISPTGTKKEVWDSFPENMHQVMYPLLSSRYTLAYPSQPKKIHPLFGSVHGTVFLEWAHNWTGQLIPSIESESIRELLRTVHPSMRRDVRTLFLFMPYVLLHAIMSNKNVNLIQEEIMAVIGVENNENNIPVTVERSKYKMLRHIRMTPNINSVQAEGNQNKCSKTIYTLLDFLNRWLLEWTNVKQRPLENENYKSIKKFVESFDKLMIARGNYACGELERALQYLELYMDEDKGHVQEQLPLLAEIYALLDEPDSVAGILSIKRSEPSLKEFILTQVVTGRLQDAALCCERLARDGRLDRHSLQGMIEFYLDLDQPFTAYRLLSEHNSDNMMELSAEPLWRLGRFEQLEELVKKPVPPSRENWGLLMGRILLAYRKEDHDMFTTSCDNAMKRLLQEMDGKSREESALRSGYQSVLGLHIITEAGHAEEVLKRLKNIDDGSGQGIEVINELLGEWRQRLSVVQSDFRTIEPLLRLRRILLHQTQELLEPTHPLTASRLKTCIGDLWLQSAKHARKAGVFQQSYMYILNAEEYKPEELFIEKAKIYWARGQQEHVMTTLRRGIEEAFPDLENLTQEQRKICAKAKLLIAKYNDETTNVDVDVNIGYYKESVEVFKQWEKSLVCLGSYYEKASSTESAANSSALWARRLYALNSYGKALQYGHKYLYQSMPRMLSIWLDVEVTAADTSIHSILAQMTEIIKTYSERLPTYLFLTAFSQIISRICHPVKEVYQQLKAIIVKLVLAYPQQSLWMSLSVLQSGYAVRARRCADVFAAPALREPPARRLLHDFTALAERLIELCNNPLPAAGSSTTVSAIVRGLPRLLSSENFSHIMMPFQEFCKIVLPSKAARQERIDFNIPTEPAVYIAGIEERVTILPSLQKPRKVTLRGSDGKAYIIMLKPRDDLRKDFRLMEFNGVVNRFLQDAPETRKRRLYIRTYSVLPLNEECGLIEWVPNLLGLRPVLMHIYKQKGIHTNNRELKEMMCSNKDPVEKKRRIYEEQLLPRHPPVFQEWFRRVFSDPYGWYQARSAYIRTTAVMSMVGYILGLGDRHGENISFDSTNGDTVHVDFNCLFNKGESFEWPERVPFRLTHNMEAAMGPLKHEGMFRKSCEAVMVALRAQTAALMSVIGPFVYDPLVSWGRSRALEHGERTNEQALQHLQHIRQRLNGMVKTKNKQLSLSLSPEGQVEHLIIEATSVHNLCQMYIGWGPFL
ncbi:serine/threonine-protein kinase ATR-like [Vanessa tameamea]|uniref:Serine/threonine-protein kinase ATR n=1 Tax=Vanessa tameamea TaxID=334116 RepID=A0A8B8HTT9_VANTA